MTTRLQLAVQGDLREWTFAISQAVEGGARVAMRKATFGMRNDLRARIRRARFRSPGLWRGLVGKVTGSGFDVEGRVYSVVRYKAGDRRRQETDLVLLYSQGATITASGGRYLAIPTGKGPRAISRGRARFALPSEMARLGWHTRVAPSRQGRKVVIGRPQSGGQEVVTHVLVPNVNVQKRYDLDAGVEKWTRLLPKLLADAIDTEANKQTLLSGS